MCMYAQASRCGPSEAGGNFTDFTYFTDRPRTPAAGHKIAEMTVDELCATAKGLSPRAASMASAMLPLTGPLPTALHSALTAALDPSAHNVEPLTAGEVQDVLHAAVRPADCAPWLRDNDDFVQAHRFAVTVCLTAECLTTTVLELLLEDHSTVH